MVAIINRYLYRIAFPHGRYLGRFPGIDNPLDDEDDSGGRYADALRNELQPMVSSGEIQTHPRSAFESGGPGIEFDVVELMVGATAVAGGYAGWRVLAEDLRAIIKKLRELGDGRIQIDEYTAEVLAVDYASDASTFNDIDLRFVALVRGWDDDQPQPERGFLVGMQVNGVDRLVVVSVDGQVLGVSTDVRLEGMSSLGI